MTTTAPQDVFYDPYDNDIYIDPYPVYRRLREEAPLYYNERYDFYALSRFDDVQKGLLDHGTFSSAHGVILEQIRANAPSVPGVYITEDPPIHSAHRGLESRVFTPKKMAALEPELRALCAEMLDPFVERRELRLRDRSRRTPSHAGDRDAAGYPRGGPSGCAGTGLRPHPARARPADRTREAILRCRLLRRLHRMARLRIPPTT